MWHSQGQFTTCKSASCSSKGQHSGSNRVFETYALLDIKSDTVMYLASLVDELEVETVPVNFVLSSMAGD